jgi:hypothetical protein
LASVAEAPHVLLSNAFEVLSFGCWAWNERIREEYHEIQGLGCRLLSGQGLLYGEKNRAFLRKS